MDLCAEPSPANWFIRSMGLTSETLYYNASAAVQECNQQAPGRASSALCSEGRPRTGGLRLNDQLPGVVDLLGV